MDNLLKRSPEDIRNSFRTLKSLDDIAVLLEITAVELKHVLYRLDRSEKYFHFFVPKRRGGTREISAPCRQLKFVQRRLCEALSCIYVPKACVHGFARGRSIVGNAKTHTAQRYVLNIDLKDFFPAINFGRVRGMFIGRPHTMPPCVATILAQICCTDSLPQGAPTSPIISNMICARMDSELARFAGSHRCSYTRYADDLTFSTSCVKFPESVAVNDPSDESSINISPELAGIIQDNGFEINADKITFRKRFRRQEVTGFVTNKTQNVKREHIRQIRAMLHAWKKYGEKRAEDEHFAKYYQKHRNPDRRHPRFRQIVVGKIQFVGMVRGQNHPLYLNLCRQLNSLEADLIRFVDPKRLVIDALWVLESEKDSIQGTGVMIQDIGLVTCDHVLRKDTVAFKAMSVSKKHRLEIVARDSTLDLAIARIPDADSVGTALAISSQECEMHDQIMLAGFPNYRYGDTGVLKPGLIIGFRPISTIRRALIDAAIIAGNSGGPVVNTKNEVVGIAATGADRMEHADDTENHSMIPIFALERLGQR